MQLVHFKHWQTPLYIINVMMNVGVVGVVEDDDDYDDDEVDDDDDVDDWLLD